MYTTRERIVGWVGLLRDVVCFVAAFGKGNDCGLKTTSQVLSFCSLSNLFHEDNAMI